MKTFKQIISEVAEPLGDDEKRFKAKHVVQKINHPKGEEDQFTAKKIKKDKSKISGYKSGEDEAVYEEKMMTCKDCGEEYKAGGECDCEDDEEEDDDLDEATLTDLENKRKEHIVTGMKKSEADLKARYGDKWKSLMYATATKNALYDEANQIGEAKKTKPGHNAAVMSKNISKVLSAVKKEEVELDEAAKTDDHWVHIKHAGNFPSPKNDTIVGYSRPSKDAPKLKSGANGAMRVGTAKKKGYMVEESEQIDEISRDLARSYIRKVSDKKNTGEASPKEVMKRSPGVALAGKKAYGIGGKAKVNATESVGQIDEISKDLKKSYLAKAKDDVADRKKTISQANKMKNASSRNFHSHSLWMDVAYKNQDKNDSRKAMMAKAKDSMKVKKEEVELDEAFKSGKMKLNDGSSVTLTNESSNALNNLFNQLTSTNKTKMEQKLMSGSNGFNEILAFAKEV